MTSECVMTGLDSCTPSTWLPILGITAGLAVIVALAVTVYFYLEKLK